MSADIARRILIDGSMARSGGGATYVRNLVPRLASLRPQDRFRIWLRQGSLASALPELPNLEVDLLPDVGWAERLRFLLFGASARARAWGCDVYFSTAEYTPPRPPRPVIASFRNWNVFTRLELGWPLGQRARLAALRSLARLSARSCDRILFVSEDSASAIGAAMGIPPERRAVVPHGIDLAGWSRIGVEAAALPGARPYILSVSSVYRYKNFVRLIEAWARLTRRRPDTPDLVIAGDVPDGVYWRQMQSAREATGTLAQRVHLLGEVPYASIRSWYAGASAFVFASYLETFGHPLLEAMAMELPIVASDIPVFREIAGDAARFFDPQDVAALEAALEDVLGDPARAADLARRGHGRATEFSWERSARLHAELFENASG